MSEAALRLARVAGTYAVCRLDPGADPGPRPDGAALYGVTWSNEETSVVCPVEAAPEASRVEGPFAALRVVGTLDFSLTGVLAGLTTALAGGGVSVFAISTYDTDYLLVPEDELGPAAERLREAGHDVSI
jgi:uncharacterized protein